MARLAKKTDLNEAETFQIFQVLTYNMENVLGLLKFLTNVVYYKLQISIHNKGIHAGLTDIPHCFTWKEEFAGRGHKKYLPKYIDLHLKNGGRKSNFMF